MAEFFQYKNLKRNPYVRPFSHPLGLFFSIQLILPSTLAGFFKDMTFETLKNPLIFKRFDDVLVS